jgi:hypothetical protein
MSKYSFLLQAEEIEYFDLLPTLRLQKHGDWLVAESIEQEEINRTQSQATIRAVQLAKKIAAARDIALDEAFEMLQGAGGLTEMDLLRVYRRNSQYAQQHQRGGSKQCTYCHHVYSLSR